MGTTRVRLGAAVAGIAAVALLGACGSGDSTVSAPASSSDDATTAVTSSAPASSSTSEDPSVDPSAPVGGSSLPATAPSGTSSAPAGFPGGAAAPQGSKGEAFLAELKREGVTVPNDPDNSIALGAAEFVCAEKARNTPAAQVKTFVTAIVGSGTTDAAAASANADKVIAAANSKYCG
ncbi:DUF732 domain-containing protein [Williamsia serinedens]|uniref:DUF732 domain-containing protein n=1 Tax=Williamsia serinedens TaxID=391736 RepID=A0ABT1GZ17_9NOCA|nr:DUF732 domain-containing protein [Williamsia serinedens]MCP2159762.1 Protein of unknown function (DUF732) [Williamsia serinedens]